MKIQKYTALFNIIICLLLLSDAFVLGYSSQTANIAELYSKYTHARNTSYYNYFLVTDKQQRYEVFWQTYDDLNIGDPVVIQSTPLLKMPKAIYYCKERRIYKKPLGQLNNNAAGKYGLFICLALSAFGLVDAFFPASKHKHFVTFFLLLATALTFLIFVTTMVEVIMV